MATDLRTGVTGNYEMLMIPVIFGIGKSQDSH